MLEGAALAPPRETDRSATFAWPVEGPGDGRPTSLVGPSQGRRAALALAQRLHDTVVQRLVALSLLLDADGAPAEEGLARCRDEVRAALGELRTGVEEMLAGDAAPDAGVRHELAVLAREHPGVVVDCSALSPLADDPLVEAFLAEGLRNARKHARPRLVVADLRLDEETIEIRLRNDGTGPRPSTGGGIGIRLLATQASFAGGLVDSGPASEDGWWQLRLILPIDR